MIILALMVFPSQRLYVNGQNDDAVPARSLCPGSEGSKLHRGRKRVAHRPTFRLRSDDPVAERARGEALREARSQESPHRGGKEIYSESPNDPQARSGS